MSERIPAKFWAIIVTVMAAFFSYGVFIQKPRWDQEMRLFQSMGPADVTRIDIQSTYPGSRDLVKAPFSIQDAGQIHSICQAMREAREYSAGHPVAKWSCDMHFVTAARTWRTRISSTSNGNGVTIRVDDGNGLRNDSLGPMLEKIVIDHEQTNPALSRP
jgi:hypothetical protein